jgi:UDP:flavonoid glycosyltransferase YjiC (YdhE family)
MLLIPAGGEQSDIAEICQTNGLARVISPEEATPDKIRSELESLLHNSDMHKRAKQVANAFAAIDSVSVTANMLEQLAQSRKPQPLLRTAKG